MAGAAPPGHAGSLVGCDGGRGARESDAPCGTGVALTFDDGPSASCTPRVLDVLRQHGVRATFFLLGEHVARLGPVVERTVAEGHAVGLHGYTHPALRLAWDVWALREELERAREALWRAARVETRLYRAPHGRAAPWVRRWLGRSGWTLVGWDVSARDWRPAPPQVLATRVLRRLRPGAVVLLHDGAPHSLYPDREHTVRALPMLLAGGVARGLTFVPLAPARGTLPAGGYRDVRLGHPSC